MDQAGVLYQCDPLSFGKKWDTTVVEIDGNEYTLVDGCVEYAPGTT